MKRDERHDAVLSRVISATASERELRSARGGGGEQCCVGAHRTLGSAERLRAAD